MVVNANSSQNLDFTCDLQQTVKGLFYGIFVKLKSNEIVLFVTFRCLRKNSVKTTHSQQFRWIFISRNFSSKWKQCTRWKNEKFFLTEKNFHQTIAFTKFLAICSWGHEVTVQCGKTRNSFSLKKKKFVKLAL